MDKIEHRNIVARIAKIREAANIFIEQELAKRGMTGVVPAHGPVFAYLFKQGEAVSISSLVHKTGKAKSTVTGIVKTMERHGYLCRTTSPEDARSVLISLTEKGWSFRDDFSEISDLLQQRLFGDMPIEERKLLAELLDKVENNMKK